MSGATGRGGVLVTGASTGIGFATVRRIAARGGVAYAGVRTRADADAVARACGPNAIPLLLDVTDRASVERAYDGIAGAADVRLNALVNNAGIALAGPLELLPASELRRVFDVNFFAPVALVQAFLPLLARVARPRRQRLLHRRKTRGAVRRRIRGVEICTRGRERRAAHRSARLRHRRGDRRAGRGEDADLATRRRSESAHSRRGVPHRRAHRTKRRCRTCCA